MATTAAPGTLFLGEVEVIRIIEYEGTTRPPEAMFPEVGAEAWALNRPWLEPEFWDAEANLLRTCVQTFALRSAGAVILVDTGVGNGKQRPALPGFHMLDTTFLARLEVAGIEPEDVDLVVNTHLHADHVGWNTRAVDGQWVPTFPNARYLLPRTDYEFWDPSVSPARRIGQANLNVFEDSIAPLVRHGQARLWDERHVIDENLTLVAAPGHTPGSSVLELESQGERAVFVGDVLHNPIQVVRPDCNSCFCEDEAAARATRRRVLGEAADRRRIVVPAHVRGRRPAMTVEHAGSGFAIGSWIEFASEESA
ncbi:MAG TPA: MBL fold metallo-hydrolase [Actinocrinis sp.]|nr:MBL fold metallo-hydrolase [Actinocrinis sp.]